MKRNEPSGSGRGKSYDLGSGIQFDQTDREILRILLVDGRTSNVEIARRIGCTETTVRKRVAAMLTDGLMEIVAVPSPRLEGLNVSGLIGVSVQLSHLKEVADSLTARREVRYCGVSTGRYDIVIEAFFSSNAHLLEFTTGVLGPMPGITGVETSLILRVEKFSYEWQFS